MELTGVEIERVKKVAFKSIDNEAGSRIPFSPTYQALEVVRYNLEDQLYGAIDEPDEIDDIDD